jgi:6,7-dimethyl-8-ribityllumazine synthase
LSARALSVTAMVADGLMRLMLSARKAIGISVLGVPQVTFDNARRKAKSLTYQ